MNPANNIDFTNRLPMKPLPNGRYAIEPGEYYVVNGEAMEFPSGDEYIDIRDAIEDPSVETDAFVNKMVGGRIDGEPLYTTVEGWSCVSNTIMTPKLYDALIQKGMEYTGGDKPAVIVFTKPTTLGKVDGEPYEDNPDYGTMEVGDKKVDLFYGDDSIVLSERTVID